MMKIAALAFATCLLLACKDDAVPSGARGASREDSRRPDAGAAVADGAAEMDARVDSGEPERPPRPMADAAVAADARVAVDARVDLPDEPDAEPSATDASAPGPRIDAGPPRDGMLRNLSLNMTGMDDDVARFAQFRVVNAQDQFHIMFVIHEGLPTATYAWQLPNALFTGQSYRLDFFLDHDQTTGPGFYDEPPTDHSWSIPIPAGDGDVSIDFAHNDAYVDIEDIAPETFHSLYLTSTDLGEHRGLLYDVRVIDRSNGRLVGRQVREIPGDVFDLTVGSTLHAGVEYQIDAAVDADANGRYNHDADPSWRVIATAADDDLRVTLNATSAQVDVGF